MPTTDRGVLPHRVPAVSAIVAVPTTSAIATVPAAHEPLRCCVCRRPFDFAAGEVAEVLRHAAYGYDFVHAGACVSTARATLFAEPDYDGAAFGRDPQRRRVLAAAPAAGWAAVCRETPERVLAGHAVRFEPLRWWALVEHADGTRRVEGIVRADDWLDEPGGAELPEARRGYRAPLGYASPADQELEAQGADLPEWREPPALYVETERGQVYVETERSRGSTWAA